MEHHNNSKGGFWMMVEELSAEPLKEVNDKSEKKEILDDEFFPDTSF